MTFKDVEYPGVWVEMLNVSFATENNPYSILTIPTNVNTFAMNLSFLVYKYLSKALREHMKPSWKFTRKIMVGVHTRINWSHLQKVVISHDREVKISIANFSQTPFNFKE